VVGRQNTDIADTLQLRATIFAYIWGAHWRHLAITTELSVCSGNAVFSGVSR